MMMFNKFNNYLLTHYPLLWNTRVIWVVACSLIIHLLFFLAGYLSLYANELQHYYSFRSIGSSDLYTFSILCSITVIISWMILYLRNNAFKSFYILNKFHSAREFFYLFLIFFLSISYFDSYQSGAAMKTRSITELRELREEAQIVNLAAAFIPLSKQDYFILNYCNDIGQNTGNGYEDRIDYNDSTASNFNDTSSIKVRNALKLPNAFSYRNYCRSAFISDYQNDSRDYSSWINTRNRWIDQHQTDSIRLLLEQLIQICKKYDIEQRIEPAILAVLVFSDSLNTITRTYPGINNRYGDFYQSEKSYLSIYNLINALEFADEMHSGDRNFDDLMFVLLYMAIIFATALICFRLFSRRLFLISILGSILWSIIFLMAGSNNNSNALSGFYILLFITFLIGVLLLLKTKQNKTLTGVLLNWHIYLLPFLVLVIIGLISSYYHDHTIRNNYDFFNKEKWMKEHYPISYWVVQHSELLMRLNLLFVFLYIGFFFTRLAKKWHTMPEE